MFRTLTLVLGLGALLSCSQVVEPKLPEGVQLIESHQVDAGELGISYEKYQLDNGLTVLLHQDHSDPLVHVNVTYHVGSAREEPGISGFAHFFEHMMFQGSVHAPEDLHTKLVDAMGGDLNGGTNSDTTRYYNTVPANELEKILWLEADRMAFVLPVVTQEKFEIQRATVKNERAQRYDNAPYGLLWETTGRALYSPEHPYAWPVIGYVEDLNRVGLNDLKAFFKRWYGPNNATLVVAGDIDKAETLEWIKSYFAAIPRGPEVQNAAKQPVRLEADRYVTLEDAQIRLPLLQLSFPTVYLQHDDEAPLDFLSQIIGDGKSSLLYQKLVKTGMAVQVGASHPCRELACNFNIYAIANPASGATLAQIEAVIRESLTEWAEQAEQDENLPEQLLRFQRMFKSGTIYGLEKVSGKASQLASNQTFFDKPDMVAFDLKRYGAVSPEDVRRVYQEYLDQGAVVLSIVPKGQPQLASKEQNYQLPAPLQPQADQLVQQEVKAPELNESLDRHQMPATGEAIQTQLPQSWEFTLDNGVQVKGATTSEIPTVALTLSIEGGPLVETREQAGLARLTSQMMMESSQLRSAEELADALDSYGSQVQFQARGRSTEVRVSSLVEYLPETLQVMQEMLFQPAFKAEDFERIKQQTLQFLKQSETNPKSIASRAKKQLLWGESSRLGLPDRGTFDTVSAITLEDVKAYYQANYSSAMASVVLVGDVEPEQAKKELSFLASWEGEPIPLPEALPGQTQYQGKIILVDEPSAAQAVLAIGRPALPFDATGEQFRLNLANHPFGATFTSRANQLLREQKGYTYGAFSRFSGGKTQGQFALNSSLLQDKTADAVKDAIELLETYAEQGATDKEIADMRSAVTQGEALSYESTGQKAHLLGLMQAHGLKDDFVERQQAIIQTITPDELNGLVKRWLDPKSMWVLVVADARQVEAELAKIEGWQLEKLQLN